MKNFFLTLCIICCLPIYGNAQPCTYSRPSIYSFSSTERLQLRNLILTYLRTSINDSFGCGSQRYPLVYMHTMHSALIHNYTKSFTTWHRYYLQELENWLIDNGHSKYVPLPAWNPNDSIPNEFFNSNAGSSALVDSCFPLLAHQKITPSSSYYNLIPDSACHTHTSDDDYSGDLEGSYHDGVHGAIGGSMGSIGTAPGAAIFWLWHAWVDDMWFCYQRHCDSDSSDVYARDTANDSGAEGSGVRYFWNSPDIWARNTNDGFQNQSNQNIIQVPGKVAYVYVRTWQKGNMPNDDGSGTITAYWAKGNTMLSWPTPWDGSTSINCGGINRPLGGVIGTKPLRRVNENFYDFTMMDTPLEKDYYIYEYAWTIPDPDWYRPCFPDTGDQQHFCLLAKINDGHAMTLTSNLGYDVEHYNNMAMKNIAIIGDGVMSAHHGSVLWGNITDLTMTDVCLKVKFATSTDAGILTHATLKLKLDATSTAAWAAAGGVATNMTYVDGAFTIMGDDASLCGFNLSPGTINTVDLAETTIVPTTGTYALNLIQTTAGNIVGGEAYQINLGTASARDVSMPTVATGISIGNAYTIYPNPTQNAFQIIAKDNNYNIETRLYDNLGRCVKVFDHVNAASLLDVHDLPAGLYFVKITNVATKQVSVQKLLLEK
jgi:hypothetical protein